VQAGPARQCVRRTFSPARPLGRKPLPSLPGAGWWRAALLLQRLYDEFIETTTSPSKGWSYSAGGRSRAVGASCHLSATWGSGQATSERRFSGRA
jgi:hypothetical protein